MIRIGNNLKQYRELAGESQGDIARLLNVSRTSVSNWESGLKTPRDDIKVLLARHYGVSVERLFFTPDLTACVQNRRRA